MPSIVILDEEDAAWLDLIRTYEAQYGELPPYLWLFWPMDA